MNEPMRSAMIFSLMTGGFATLVVAGKLLESKNMTHARVLPIAVLAAGGMAMLMLGVLMALIDIFYNGYR